MVKRLPLVLVILAVVAACFVAISQPFPFGGFGVTPITLPSLPGTAPAQASPTSAPTPRPTLTPAEHEVAATRLYTEAIQSQTEGDFELAAGRLAEIVAQHPSTSPATDAGFRLGECYLAMGSNSQALASFRWAIARTPAGAAPTSALVLAGDAARALGDLLAAAGYYEQYIRANTPSAGYVLLRLGDAYLAMNKPDAALGAYQRAADAGLPPSPTVDALDRMATVYIKQKAYPLAIARYVAILDIARTPTYRSYVLHRLGAAYESAGMRDEAAAAWLRVVNDYPETENALPSLRALDAQGSVQVDPYQRAWVQFNASAYVEAIASWRRYVAAAPRGDGTAWARYYIGQSFQRQGEYASAITEYDTLIRLYGSGAAVSEARLARARCLRLQGDEKAAAAAYLAVARSLPGTTQAQRAFLEGGLSLYRNGDTTGAVSAWQELLTAYPRSDYRVRAQFWAGKGLLNLGRATEGRRLLIEAAGERPPSHYALRAADLLGTVAPSSPAPAAWADMLATSRRGGENWLSEWTAAAPPRDSRAARLAAEPHLVRALELTALHMAGEAADEFRLAEEALAKDPWALLEMSLQLHERGLYQPAVGAASRLLAQSPAAWAGEAPASLQPLLYPYPYRGLFERSAKQYTVDPLLFASMVRQESLFSARATSSADARGLAQVIPPTARSIADALGKKDFRLEDLYRPRLSLEFGAFYLSEMLKLTKGNVWMALASYNGGYGNASRWAGGKTDIDQDLFLENVVYSETQAYLQAVSRNQRFYRSLYGP